MVILVMKAFLFVIRFIPKNSQKNYLTYFKWCVLYTIRINLPIIYDNNNIINLVIYFK